MQDMHSKQEAQSQLECSASIQSHISGRCVAGCGEGSASEDPKRGQKSDLS